MLMIRPMTGLAQESITPETIRNAQRSVCAIKTTGVEKGNNKVYSLGCGVVMKTKIKDREGYFVATTLHLVKGLLEQSGTRATVSVFDRNGSMYEARDITGEYILWYDAEMDAAIFVLPQELAPVTDLPADYSFPGPASLRLIGEPEWGQDIYLFGYRWIEGDVFIDILKKGILSVGTMDLPGYEGRLVYLIDNMANKGMSGGLAFTANGTGVGIISSYVYEWGEGGSDSGDLTVCLPLAVFFKALGNLVIMQGDRIGELMGE